MGSGRTSGPSYLAFSLGRTLDTTITVAKLILTGLLDRHPNLKLVLVHGGGYLPYQAARIDSGYVTGQGRPVELERDRPSDYLPMLYYDNVAVSPQVVRLMRDIAGAENLFLGSDYVFAGPRRPIAGNLEGAGLDAQKRYPSSAAATPRGCSWTEPARSLRQVTHPGERSEATFRRKADQATLGAFALAGNRGNPQTSSRRL